jgi:hypothetical protein
MPICKICQRERRPLQMHGNGNCASCNTRKWQKANPEHQLKLVQNFKRANPDYHRKYMSERYWGSADFRATTLARSYRLSNRQPYKDLPREKERIELIYFVASRITELSGIKHHVDHIVPIKGTNVSGLHVACNLRVITASKNMSKGNSYG